MALISTIPYNDPANSFAWLEWFRQMRDLIDSLSRYGSFTRTTDAVASAINTATLITFDTNTITEGITITDSSKITIPKTGVYVFDFSVQITSTNASTKNLWFWPRVNGVNAAGFTMKQSITNNSTTNVISRTGVFKLNKGDYLQAYWATDDLNVSLKAEAATAFAPATPAVILSVAQIG